MVAADATADTFGFGGENFDYVRLDQYYNFGRIKPGIHGGALGFDYHSYIWDDQLVNFCAVVPSTVAVGAGSTTTLRIRAGRMAPSEPTPSVWFYVRDEDGNRISLINENIVRIVGNPVMDLPGTPTARRRPRIGR